MQWLEHESTASGDDRIMSLRMEFPGEAAVDCYWAIVEKQYRDERPVPFSETDRETKALAHRLCVGFDTLEKYVKTMLEVGLLKTDDSGNVYSERAKRAIEKYREKCEIARQNGKSGGRKPKQKPTQKPSVKPTQKPSRNRAAAKENNTGMGFDKQNPYPVASDGADAANAAPPSAIECPTCGVKMERTASRVSGTDRHYWRCPLCNEEVAE